MGLFIRQDDNRSELQRRLAEELQEKARKKSELDNQPLPDGVKDANYMKDFSVAGKLLWVWVLLIVLVIVGTILMLAFS